ncbi:UDP-N-acetylmuramoyl-L-alanine--D-glutamate ligase [Prochlorococcus marinus]|uniref:UDP-N-acetylmuramoylalanine--D-glutamate ligase n=1 Tax=Prochlorococcus marinus (strain MIT 9211) TaxID=93059 RepID=A9BBY1_PROM4|nr:UDP-N-acetylmuramoylalanine--D-glutamate ligase [Prochlorococcus marinus str. MIT 9211]
MVGLGRSGLGAAKLLNEQGANVVVFEQSNGPSLEALSKELNNQGIDVKLGVSLELKSFEPWLSNLKSVVTSPAIAWDHCTLNALRNKGIEIESEISLAWKALKHIPWIGVTGTNGKTTVTHMLHHVLNSNQINTAMGGNVGIPASQIALDSIRSSRTEPNWLVMELSSYQLETSPNISPKIGIWTTLTPDHLERHGSLENYSDIKKRLLENSSIRIYNLDDHFLKNARSKLMEGIWVSTNGAAINNNQADFWITSKGKLYEKGEEILDTTLLNIPGRHNLQNLLLVTAAAREIGLSPRDIEQAIASFKGVPHRLEKIANIKGIEIFNDSKATNYEAAKIGLEAVPSPTIVIAGGQSKKGNPNDWLQALNKKACAVVLFGASANTLFDLIRDSKFSGPVNCFPSLNDAIETVFNLAFEEKAKSILLSPACASFDQYKDYEERGNEFKKIINQWLILNS